MCDFIKKLVYKQETPALKPNITLYTISGPALLAELQPLNLKLMYPTLMDYYDPYYYTDDIGWAEVFNYIYCDFDMPPYIAARMDCEDFSILLKGLVSALFGLNGFGIVVGESPMGIHSYDLFKTPSNLMLIEPQTAEFFEIGHKGYVPKYLLI